MRVQLIPVTLLFFHVSCVCQLHPEINAQSLSQLKSEMQVFRHSNNRAERKTSCLIVDRCCIIFIQKNHPCLHTKFEITATTKNKKTACRFGGCFATCGQHMKVYISLRDTNQVILMPKANEGKKRKSQLYRFESVLLQLLAQRADKSNRQVRFALPRLHP